MSDGGPDRWSPERLAVAYDERLLDWQLGVGHPTDPVRATLAVEALRREQVPLTVEPITAVLDGELELVHSPDYLHRTLVQGRNGEWSGERADLAAVAAHMFAGTVQLVRGVEAGTVQLGFSPQGAKHHAQSDRGSGFCVFNDMAWAALHFAGRGKRVLYVDLDAHHGDGVEALTRDSSWVRTCSVHDSTIFPGTGHEHREPQEVFNYPLPRGAGDEELLAAVDDVIRRADVWQPDVVLVAIGADGHETDPLSSLQYAYGGYEQAAHLLGTFGPSSRRRSSWEAPGATNRARTRRRSGRRSWPAWCGRTSSLTCVTPARGWGP